MRTKKVFIDKKSGIFNQLPLPCYPAPFSLHPQHKNKKNKYNLCTPESMWLRWQLNPIELFAREAYKWWTNRSMSYLVLMNCTIFLWVQHQLMIIHVTKITQVCTILSLTIFFLFFFLSKHSSEFWNATYLTRGCNRREANTLRDQWSFNGFIETARGSRMQ